MRVVQIIPAAPGTKAAWCSLGETEDPLWMSDVICWAVVVEERPGAVKQGSTSVMGMVATPEDVTLTYVNDDDGNFLGYIQPGEGLKPWRGKAIKQRSEASEKEAG